MSRSYTSSLPCASIGVFRDCFYVEYKYLQSLNLMLASMLKVVAKFLFIFEIVKHMKLKSNFMNFLEITANNNNNNKFFILTC
jgi:hypothetical protein